MGKSDLTWGYTKTSEHAHSSSLIPTHSYPPKIYLKPTLLTPPLPTKNFHPIQETQNIPPPTPTHP